MDYKSLLPQRHTLTEVATNQIPASSQVSLIARSYSLHVAAYQDSIMQGFTAVPYQTIPAWPCPTLCTCEMGTCLGKIEIPVMV